MNVQPSYKYRLLDDWLSNVSTVDLGLVDDSEPYDPGAAVEGDVNGWVGVPQTLNGVQLDLVGSQVWLVYDNSPIVFTGVPAATVVTGLWLVADGELVGFVDRRADGSPVTFTATGGGYTVGFPNGFLLRM